MNLTNSKKTVVARAEELQLQKTTRLCVCRVVFVVALVPAQRKAYLLVAPPYFVAWLQKHPMSIHVRSCGELSKKNEE